MFTLVIATAQASATLATDGVNLVNKNDARCVFLGIIEHVSYAGCTHADKHFNEIGTRNREKRNLCFARNTFGKQGFSGARRANQQQTARNASAKFLKL